MKVEGGALVLPTAGMAMLCGEHARLFGSNWYHRRLAVSMAGLWHSATAQ